MNALVYATAATSVRWRGGIVRLAEGDAWDADDPFVRSNPGFFAEDPTKVHHSRGAEAPVEQATAAPGEKRSTRRG